MEHPKASPSRLAAILLFVPAAVGAAYPAVFGGVILVRGLAAGSEDVLFAEDSGAPGWLFAVLGLALLACVAVVLHIAWLVAFDRAGGSRGGSGIGMQPSRGWGERVPDRCINLMG